MSTTEGKTVSTTNRTIDLIADIGEGFGSYRMGDDDALLDSLTSANVACGFHAGDPRTIERAVASCVEKGVSIGAHPGFPDLVGFGRREVSSSYDEVRTDVLYQIGALHAFVEAAGASLSHVTPHGRLGNLVVTDRTYAEAVAAAVEAFDPTLILVAQSGELEHVARERGLIFARLGLVDRAYEDDGTLVSRREEGAVLHDPEEIAERTISMVVDGTVRSRNGKLVEVDCDTVLLHGDNPGSIRAAALVRSSLEAAGVVIAPLRAADALEPVGVQPGSAGTVGVPTVQLTGP